MHGQCWKTVITKISVLNVLWFNNHYVQIKMIISIYLSVVAEQLFLENTTLKFHLHSVNWEQQLRWHSYFYA